MSISASKSTTSGLRMMTVNRGFTEEADNLLNYLVGSILFAFGVIEPTEVTDVGKWNI